MEFLAEIILAIIGDLPIVIRTTIGLMAVLQFMAAFALGALRLFGKEGLPWGASSDRLYAAMIFLVCLPAVVVTLLFIYYIVGAAWQEVADSVQQAAHWRR